MPIYKSAGLKGGKVPVAAVSLAGLAADKEASSKKFGKAPATTEKYGQCQQQGFKWLNDLMAVEARTQQPLGCPSQGSLQDASTMFSLEVLAHAFDKIPMQASPWVLGLFIASNCFGDNACGPATAWQIYSAFKMMWHHAWVFCFDQIFLFCDPNGKYQGRWRWDEERHCGHGNPAQSTEVDDIITAVKNRDGAEGKHFHSCAMKLEYMDRIMEWSSTQCPSTILWELDRLHGEEYHLRLPKATKHYFMCAFAASGWTIWTRNFELAKLQYKHIIEDAWTDDRYRFRHLVVILEHQKGWENKLSKEIDLQGHRYEIHSQREMPSVDMEFHLHEWLVFLRAFVYGHDLEDGDYIFPSVNTKGLTQPGMAISHDSIQKWLNEFVTGAGIKLSTDPPRDLRIPPLPKTGPMNARWKQAMHDWQEQDLSRGHSVALKDWHPTWYSGANREAFGMQYGKRKLIALELLDSCKGDEAEFLRKWPVADSGSPTKLLKAIHRARIESGSTKCHRTKEPKE
ncbi:hypothetical protein JB92DRAFT_3120946 [Gautieria morchelliformis]|nr:hypothetical protein JB92DRAFT_3120946 [Gautieria morchelliformis]